MINGKYQKAKYISDMLAEESTHGLNMQVVLAELPEGELRVLEKIAHQCRTARAPERDLETVTFVVDMEEEFA